MRGLLPADSGKIASHVFAGSNVALRTQPWSTYGWPVVHLVVVIVIGRAVVAVVTMLGPGRTPRGTVLDSARLAGRGWIWPGGRLPAMTVAGRGLRSPDGGVCWLPVWLPQNSLVSLSSSAYRQPDSQLPRVTVPPERRGGCSFSQSVNRDERADEPRSHSVIDTPAAPHAERTFRVPENGKPLGRRRDDLVGGLGRHPWESSLPVCPCRLSGPPADRLFLAGSQISESRPPVLAILEH
jgi:hypothetical protein